MARRAGVGTGTVSRVLNGSPQVTAATRDRVLEAIAQLDYRPRRAARALASGRTGTVGVLAGFFTEPAAVERLRGIVDVIAGGAYDLVIYEAGTHARLAQALDRVLDGSVDGLLAVSAPVTAEVVSRARAADLPVVAVDASPDGLPGVWVDNVRGGELAAEHLLALGHDRVGFVGDDPDLRPGPHSSEDRRAGFIQALRRAGAAPAPEHVRCGPHGRAEAAELAAGVLSGPDRPTAIFAASDTQALGVLEAARAAGLDVPGDLSVVGFDDIELAAHVRLTTVRQPLYESGVRGASLLLELLSEPERPPGRPRAELHLELVQRMTTAPVPGARRR